MKVTAIVPAYNEEKTIGGVLNALTSSNKINKIIVVNLSGRGDKDLFLIAKAFKDKKFFKFLKDYIKEEDESNR